MREEVLDEGELLLLLEEAEGCWSRFGSSRMVVAFSASALEEMKGGARYAGGTGLPVGMGSRGMPLSEDEGWVEAIVCSLMTSDE